MTKLVGFLARFWRARSGVSAAEYMLWLAIMVAVGTFVLS
jgi:Flp pilus assembly pilin Flp